MIKSIFLDNFRCFSNQKLVFSDKINVFLGSNGVGKTSIIEAISILTVFRSFRSRKFNDFLNNNADFKDYFCLQCDFSDEISSSSSVKIAYSNNRKVIFLNGDKIKKASDYIGLFPSISVSKADFLLFQKGPSERREMFDLIFCQISTKYVDAINYYNKTLNEKNALLKDFKNENRTQLESLLDVYDEKLIELSKIIISYRMNFIKKINEIIDDYFTKNEINMFNEKVLVQYSPFVSLPDVGKEVINHRSVDILSGHGVVGPHKDDYIFIINNKNVENYGSQGQQKTAILEVKFALASLVEKTINKKPILLLDDVLGDLDENRINSFLDFFSDKYQTFITTTNIDMINEDNLKKINLIEINEKGEIKYGK